MLLLANKNQYFIKAEELRKMTSPQKRKYDSPQPSPDNTDSDESDEYEESSEDVEDLSPLEEVDFTRKSPWTDLTLKVEDKQLYVPKSHLALTSRIFRVMFQSDFKEKNLDVLPLPDKKYEDVLTFLKFTHPAARLIVTYDVIPKLLPLAHEYEVQALIDDCVRVMITEMNDNMFALFRERPKHNTTYTLGGICGKIITTNAPNIFNPSSSKINNDVLCKCCKIGILAERYSLKTVLDVVIKRLSTVCYFYYKQIPEFTKLPLGIRYEILSRRLDGQD